MDSVIAVRSHKWISIIIIMTMLYNFKYARKRSRPHCLQGQSMNEFQKERNKRREEKKQSKTTLRLDDVTFHVYSMKRIYI